MKNKSVYLTIGIIVILVIAIFAYIQYSSPENTVASVSPSPTVSPTLAVTPTVTPSATSSPSSTPSASANPTTAPPSPSQSSSPSSPPASSSSSEIVSITIASGSPSSGSINVDGTVVSLPAVFQWQVGATHSLQAISPVAGAAGTQYVWTSWSDNGAQTHTYTVPNSDATITANYKTQYEVDFTQSGLDSSADETVLTTNLGNANYADMPFTVWADSGTQVTYTFEANESTTCPRGFFMLADSGNSNTITVNEPKTVTATYTRAIVDANGKVIHVPDPSNIHRIADSWPAHNTIVVMVGAKEKLVATATTNTVNSMFQKILPAIATMLTPFNSDGTVNIEALMAEDPDIVFVSASGEAAASAMENSGLLVVRLQFFDFDDMVSTVHLTGWILGEDALAKAVTYIDYFNGVQDKITSVTSQIPPQDRPEVLHITGTGTSPLSIDAGEGLINTWINLCGGNNAAAEVPGNMQTVSFEQILSWNPEIIMIGSANANTMKTQLLNDPLWNEITAVKNGNVIANPMGVFDWARYSVEEALNIQWVAKTLHPDLFSNINIRAETQYFYHTFYQYDLSEAEIDAILR